MLIYTRIDGYRWSNSSIVRHFSRHSVNFKENKRNLEISRHNIFMLPIKYYRNTELSFHTVVGLAMESPVILNEKKLNQMMMDYSSTYNVGFLNLIAPIIQ